MLKFARVAGQYFKNLRILSHRTHSNTSNGIMLGDNYQVGQKIHGYIIKRIEDVPELMAKAYFMVHKKTLAQHLHIWREDNNNVVAVSFRTVPHDDTGVAHILEHLVTMGSINFPCREVFFKMRSRSLATYMNASTGPDYTAYPFSSTNARDIENLTRVYMDFVFNPTLRELDFRQEAWRLEHENINDQSSPLQFKGVVLSEMKGVYSDTSSIYIRYILKYLYPDTVYRYDFGGDPFYIPKLSVERMKDFYSKYYHPSNARFFTYGDMPFERHLELINGLVLSHREPDLSAASSSNVEPQKLWTCPEERTVECRPDPMAPFPDKQTTVSLSYLLSDVTDSFESFVLSFISSLLTSGQNSEFYTSLIGSGLGMDFSPGTGYWDFIKQPLFTVGLQGIHKDDLEKVTNIIQETFKKAAQEGFSQQRIEALLHLIELSLKHQSSNFGMNLLYHLQSIWNHNGDPIALLKINEKINRFRFELEENPKFLQEKVDSYFLKNPHNLKLIMTASEDYVSKHSKKEKELLQGKIAELTKDEREEIYKQGLELSTYLNKKQDPSCLPILDVSTDISKDLISSNLSHVKVLQTPVQVATYPTNSVLYFRALFSFAVDQVPQDLKPYWPIFCDLITKLGAGPRNFREMDQEIKMRTGGLVARSHILENYYDSNEYEPGLYVYSHCLPRNIEAMFHLWNDIFNKLRYDEEEHISHLIKMMAAEESSSLAQAGHSYALLRAASSLKSSCAFREMTSGLSHILFLKKLAEKNNMTELKEKLVQLGKHVFSRDNVKIALNSENFMVEESIKQLEHLVLGLSEEQVPKKSETVSMNYPILSSSTREHYVFPFNTNYVAKAVLCVPFSHPDHPKLRILSALLSSKYLLEELREKGTAYGAGASINLGGIFSFYSYRDRGLTKTVEIFDSSLSWILTPGNVSEQDLKEAKLSVFQVIDKPTPPGKKGTRLFMEGVNDEMFNKYRLQLLNVTLDDIFTVAKDYLNDKVHQRVVSIGPDTSSLDLSQWQKIENLEKTNNLI